MVINKWFPLMVNRSSKSFSERSAIYQTHNKSLIVQVKCNTRQLSVVVVSGQSEACIAFLRGTNALEHIKSYNNEQYLSGWDTRYLSSASCQCIFLVIVFLKSIDNFGICGVILSFTRWWRKRNQREGQDYTKKESHIETAVTFYVSLINSKRQ